LRATGFPKKRVLAAAAALGQPGCGRAVAHRPLAPQPGRFFFTLRSSRIAPPAALRPTLLHAAVP